MTRTRSMVWSALVIVLALVGSGAATGGAAVASQGTGGPALVAQSDSLELLAAVAAVYDPAWESPGNAIHVPGGVGYHDWFSWHAVPDVAGVHALAFGLEDRAGAGMPERLLVWVRGIGDVRPFAQFGLLAALVDGDDRHVKASAPLTSDSQFLRWSGAEAGDALLLVDPTGQWAESQGTSVRVGAQDDAEPFPTLQVGAPSVEAGLWQSRGSLLGFGYTTWFRVADAVPAGQWVALDLGIDQKQAAVVSEAGVFDPDGTRVVTQQSAGAAPGDPPRTAWRARAGQLVFVSATNGRYYPVPGEPDVRLFVHAALVVPDVAPSAPRNVLVERVEPDAVTLNWWPPEWSGSSPVTGYMVTASPGGARCTTTGRSCTVRLDARVGHTFTVTASNGLGTSAPSARTASVRYTGPIAATPAAPGWVSAVPRVWDMDVTWAAVAAPFPEWPITGYVVTVDEGSRLVPATARSVRMWGVNLNRPTSHTVSVAAVTTNGDGTEVFGPSRSIMVRSPGVVSAEVSDRDGLNKLRVNATPNRSAGRWRFEVQRRKASGRWAAVGTYRTRGYGQTRTLNLGKGLYRVRMLDRYGYVGATSMEVRLVR